MRRSSRSIRIILSCCGEACELEKSASVFSKGKIETRSIGNQPRTYRAAILPRSLISTPESSLNARSNWMNMSVKKKKSIRRLTHQSLSRHVTVRNAISNGVETIVIIRQQIRTTSQRCIERSVG